jgi:2-polyprenyl-3-methyl-5-hydroxy-6-metoxy-1,4-benzoquinol methylase
MDSSTRFPETYDIFTSSDDYAGRFAGRVGEWMLRVQELATLRMLAPCPNATVLDVGGGHGQLTGALLRNGFRVTVFSSAEECKARIRSYLDDGRIAFQVGDILDMPYPDRAFDVVICYRMTAHVTRTREYLRELARVAGKAVILDYPEVRSINLLAPHLYGVKKRLEPNTRRYQCFREGQLLGVFEEAGFRRADRYPQYLLPMALHRRLNQPLISWTLEKFFRLTGLTALLGSPVILKVERA